jgi:hypothetical protein
MRGTPFIPRDESALQKINIVPECIFCHQPTNNVEIRVIKKVREEYMAYRQVLRTTTTSSIPFPAHHHCYHRKRLAEKITLILACVILVLTFFTFIFVRSAAHHDGEVGMVWVFLVAAIVGLLLSLTSLGLRTYLNAKVTNYAKEHAAH